MPEDIVKKQESATLGGKLFLIGLGLSIAALGALFVWLMARSFLRARETREWPQVQCIILSSEIQQRKHDPDSPTEFSLGVTYGYEYQGRRYTSDRFALRGNSWSSRRPQAEARASEYPLGQITKCWVNPAHPDQALLKPDSLAPGYSIWFPALFVVGGLGIASRAVLARK